jgi:hypothetical protein
MAYAICAGDGLDPRVKHAASNAGKTGKRCSIREKADGASKLIVPLLVPNKKLIPEAAERMALCGPTT